MDGRKETKMDKCFKVVPVFTLLFVSVIAIVFFIFYPSADAVLSHSERIMDRADIFFGIMWKTLCNGSNPLLDQYDCNQLTRK